MYGSSVYDPSGFVVVMIPDRPSREVGAIVVDSKPGPSQVTIVPAAQHDICAEAGEAKSSIAKSIHMPRV